MPQPHTVRLSSTYRRKVGVSSVLSQLMEWYDFQLFGLASVLVFPALFFPEAGRTGAVLLSFAGLAVGFMARPLGALIFGHLGDTVGRKTVLMITLSLMGGATFVMGLLPTAVAIGGWAPVLLVLLRVLQGVGVGGEQGGATLMMVESAPPRRRGFASGVMETGEFMGLLIATGLFTLLTVALPHEQFLSWGWRVPFLISAAIAIFGLWIRTRLMDTPAFEEAKADGLLAERPLSELFKVGKRSMLLSVALRLFETGSGFLIVTFSLSYATDNAGVSESVSTAGVMIASAVSIVCIPFYGYLGDKFGRKIVFCGGMIFLLIAIWPFFLVIDTRSTPLILLGYALLYAFGSAPLLGVEFAWIAELFPTNIRFSGLSIGFQIGAILGGGIAPFLATLLVSAAHGSLWLVMLYLLLLWSISMVAVVKAPDTYRSELAATAAAVDHAGGTTEDAAAEVRDEKKSGA
ncbi:MFS transporter [Nonomuraea insulae]|uniref:MFS transporter n=1 Tax=Nonomuraea insulae TaxID=1616787 RepID=A0ABW1CGT1_9ACTN